MSAFSYVLSPIIPVSGQAADSRVALLERIDALAPTAWAYDFALGDIVIPRRRVRGVDAIIQRGVIRMRFFLGEWFLDQRLGIPYFQRIFIKDPDVREIQRLYTQSWLTVPGISAVHDMKLSIDGKTRRLFVDKFEAQISDIACLRAEKPFIV